MFFWRLTCRFESFDISLWHLRCFRVQRPRVSCWHINSWIYTTFIQVTDVANDFLNAFFGLTPVNSYLGVCIETTTHMHQCIISCPLITLNRIQFSIHKVASSTDLQPSSPKICFLIKKVIWPTWKKKPLCRFLITSIQFIEVEKCK